MIATMSATPDNAEQLLEAVRATSERSRFVKVEVDRMVREAATARRAAVQAALDSGMPRDWIAKAAGVNRNLLYRIVGKTSR